MLSPNIHIYLVKYIMLENDYIRCTWCDIFMDIFVDLAT